MRVLQTILVSKELAPSRARAEAIARKYADRIYTSRGTRNFWRFRQRPPSCFSGGYRNAKKEGGKVLLTYATLSKNARQRRGCR